MQRFYHSFPVSSLDSILPEIMHWAQQRYEHMALLNSSGFHNDPYGQYQALLAVGARKQICIAQNQDGFKELQDFSDRHHDWLFGFLSYDLKNQLENLSSNNPDRIGMPLMHFFQPEVIFIFSHQEVRMGLPEDLNQPRLAREIWQQIRQTSFAPAPTAIQSIHHRVSRSSYLDNVRKILEHIQKGDIYEANYCIEFFAEGTLNPLSTYFHLTQHNPSPFSCYYRLQNQYLISSSPERYLARRNHEIISQPIKGTIRRGKTPQEDQQLKEQLLHDPKERSENIMIVDLVRNDLSHTASKGSVKVEELCGIYSYPKVHQMISTIKSTLRQDTHFVEAIKKSFPMGSMTGAPKIRAMEIIEECETSRRGLFSGAVGYICPQKNFDFNVIIRSILYNHIQKYISFMAGSAITIASNPHKEYEECLLKAESMAGALNTTLTPAVDNA